jgi:protease-4
MTATERTLVQNEIDTIYDTFKTRVADGRKKEMGYVDSIAQGRVWSGTMGRSIGLVDRVGTMQDAVDCAARMAKTSDYRLVEYPEPMNIFERLMNKYKHPVSVKAAVKDELGEEGYRTFETLKKVKSMVGTTETRLPFDLDIE